MGFAGALNRIGPPGEPGADGKDGNKWLSGIGEPSADAGGDGDFYLNYKNADVYEKQGEQWVWVLNLKGKKGDPGKQGEPGKDGITKVMSLGSLSGNGTPYIVAKAQKVTCTNKDEEYSFALPFECKKFILRARKAAKVRIAYDPDHLISEDFLTIGLGGFYEDAQYYRQQTIYFSADRDNTIIEIVTFI
jgi:hypothetical protein